MNDKVREAELALIETTKRVVKQAIDRGETPQSLPYFSTAEAARLLFWKQTQVPAGHPSRRRR